MLLAILQQNPPRRVLRDTPRLPAAHRVHHRPHDETRERAAGLQPAGEHDLLLREQGAGGTKWVRGGDGGGKGDHGEETHQHRHAAHDREDHGERGESEYATRRPIAPKFQYKDKLRLAVNVKIRLNFLRQPYAANDSVYQK